MSNINLNLYRKIKAQSSKFQSGLIFCGLDHMPSAATSGKKPSWLVDHRIYYKATPFYKT